MRFKPLIAVCVLFGLLAGCSGAPVSPTAAPTSAPAPTAVPAPTTPPLPTQIPATPAPTASIEVLETTSAGRLIKDATGEILIPTDPACIIVAGSGYLDHLLTLGVKPCGAAHGPAGSEFPAHLAEQLEGVKNVGGTLEVNLEAVAVAQPDLIIAMHPAHTSGEFVTHFDPIAPTVYLTDPWQDWRQALLEIGLILGKQDIAEAKLAEFDARLASARERLDSVVGDQKVLFLRVLPSEIRVYGTTSSTGGLLFDDLGLAPATGTPIGDDAMSISMELIPQFDADHIFLLDQTEDQMAAIKASPLWQKVPAVQKGQVYPVDVKIWIQGEGMVAYDVLVNDVLEALIGTQGHITGGTY